jgi:hypothetical protein
MEPREYYKNNICSILCLYLFEKSFIALQRPGFDKYLGPPLAGAASVLEAHVRDASSDNACECPSSLGQFSVRRCLHVRWTGACLCGDFCEQIG